DGDELGDGRPERVELALDEVLRDLRLVGADLERRPVGDLRLRLDGDRGGELPVLVLRGRKLEVVLRLLDGTNARLRGRVPEPAADVAVDRLRHEALAADALHEQAARHLALSEAWDLRGLREVGGRV